MGCGVWEEEDRWHLKVGRWGLVEAAIGGGIRRVRREAGELGKFVEVGRWVCAARAGIFGSEGQREREKGDKKKNT